jgi:methionyl-tRNA formyltransferase
LKIAYFGLPLGALLLHHDGHSLGPVVLSPVQAPGRRRLARLYPGRLDYAVDASLDATVEAALSVEQPDLLVSWFWTRKLPRAWLEQPPLGAIGAHPSLLPRHRGPNPYFWSIDAGDPEVGVTIHRLEQDYDTGVMLARRSLPAGNRDAWQLARALDRPALALIRETTLRFARGEVLDATPQDPRAATWAPEPTGDELRVNFGWATERVLRRVRALSPTPGVALCVLGVDLFVTRAEPESDYVSALIPGEAHVSTALTLRTADGAVRVTRAYFPGGETEDAEDETEATGAAEVAATLLKRRKER